MPEDLIRIYGVIHNYTLHFLFLINVIFDKMREEI